MPDQVFEKVLSDLKDIDYKGSIHPYLMGEPLADVNIFDKIKRIRKVFPENTIFISTNGDFLNIKTLGKLLASGITWVGVSHYDKKNDHLIKLTKEFKNIVHTGFGELRQSFYNRAGHVKVGCISPIRECDWVFDKAYINHKGDVILCCSDYKYEVVFGNILNDSFDNIYNSKVYDRYRDLHRSRDWKDLKLCQNCNRII